MANILFIDSDPLALKAFRGIIERSVHKFAHASTAAEAWERVSRGPFFHLVILEIKLADGNGRAFLAGLRKHPYLKGMPVVIYTRAHDRETVRKTLELNIQNYLFKPFEDEKIFAEARRAMESPWWKEVMEPEEDVAGRMGLEVEAVRGGRQELLRQLRQTLEEMSKGWTLKAHGLLGETEQLAEKWGFELLGRECKWLLEMERPTMAQVEEFCRDAEQASRVMKEILFPGSIMSSEDLEGGEEENDGAGKTTFGMGGAPTGNFEDIKKRVSELAGYPVIDSVAASFQMAAANPDIEVETLTEMILNDPCLSVQVYYYVNHVSELSRKTEEGVQDQKHAIQLLGLTRIRSMAKGLVIIPDADVVRAGFDWKQYRTFQVGCGLIAEQLVSLLSLQINPSVAYFAGLVHELGKILLAYLYPQAYHQAISLALESGIGLAAAELQKFGCSSQELGAYFAELAKFSPEYIDAIRYYNRPETAPRTGAQLAAVVSLADYLCKLHSVGFSGSRLPRASAPLSELGCWQVLLQHVGPTFSIVRFERQAAELAKKVSFRLKGL